MQSKYSDQNFSEYATWQPLLFISISIFLLVYVSPLLLRKMGVDGIVYASIAKNLSLHYGNIWKLHFSNTTYWGFYEHPPLAIYFQSLFFKLLGQGDWIERLYCFLIFLANFSIVAWYWLKQTQKPIVPSLILLFFFYMIIPINEKFTQNNLEATFSIFSTASALILCLKFKPKHAFLIQYPMAAITMMAAFFCNGPVAFFPLAIPVMKAYLDSNTSILTALKNTVYFTALTSGLLILIFFIIPESFEYMKIYFEREVIASTFGSRAIQFPGITRLYIFVFYLEAYAIAGLLALGCILTVAKIEHQHPSRIIKTMTKNKNVPLFFLISLISSIPIGLSHHIVFRFMIPSAPFFALFMMYFCYQPIETINQFFSQKNQISLYVNRLSQFVLGVSIIIFSLFCLLNKDRVMFNDIHYLKNYLADDEVLMPSSKVYLDWITGAYFSRYSMISLEVPKTKPHPYYISLKGEPIPQHYKPLQLPLSYYQLSQLQENIG